MLWNFTYVKRIYSPFKFCFREPFNGVSHNMHKDFDLFVNGLNLVPLDFASCLVLIV